MAKVQIAQASIDEHGKTKGGQPGDQRIYTGKKGETNISDWYIMSGGWDELIRCKDESIANKAAEYIIKVTNSHLVGYNQGNRNTFYQALKKYNWNIDSYIASGEKTETDCSAYVYAIYCSLIPSLRGSFEEGRVSGRNNSPACQSSWTAYNRYGNGLFERYTNSDFVNSDAHLKVGDLLNETKHHIVMVVSTEGTVPSSIPPVNDTYLASVYQSTGNVEQSISGTSNNVMRLSSANKKDKSVLKQDDSRKQEFESLITLMSSNAPNMGRDVIITSELFDSNILKGNQESTKERV